jgi:hypothetical protein
LFATAPAFADAFLEETLNPGTLYVGVTLGQDWSGFPIHLSPDYTEAGALDRLDVTLPLYVSWILDPDVQTQATPVVPAQPITNYPWFTASAFKVGYVKVEVKTNPGYVACPQPYEASPHLEAPTLNTFPLTAGGELNVRDIHGGTGAQTTIRLSRTDQSVVLYLGWTRPGMHRNDLTEGDDPYEPGDGWIRGVRFSVGDDLHEAFYDNAVVEWPSPDMGPSPGFTDTPDLAMFASYYGTGGVRVRWGLNTETPTLSPNFFADFTNHPETPGNPNYLDSADISHIAWDLGNSCMLLPPKAGGEEDVATIMAWFGFTPTGGMIEIAPGKRVPEFVQSDSEQTQVGINDPYGYRRHIGSATIPIPWTAAKKLYR